jgi:hypothetical protein
MASTCRFIVSCGGLVRYDEGLLLHELQFAHD